MAFILFLNLICLLLALVELISWLLCLTYLIIIGTFIFGWLKLDSSNSIELSQTLKVSVLIAARNEESNILDCLQDILKQDYPQHLLEIIVVDDHSTDRTSELVLSLSSPCIKLIKLDESKALNSYKKKAITEAINLSSGELIVTTDADCRMGTLWISSIVSRYEKGNCKLISSPVSYFQNKSLFQQLQTAEFVSLIAMGASAISNQMAFTCNGANLAYSRKVFFELSGFQGIDQVASGEDELFLHKVSAAYPGEIAFLKAQDAIVYTYAKPNLKEFLNQRKRWASKSMHYVYKLPVYLSVLVYLFYASLFIQMVIGIFSTIIMQQVILQFAVKLVIDAVFLFSTLLFFKRIKLMAYLLPASFLHIFYILFIGTVGNSGKYEWKDRMVR